MSKHQHFESILNQVNKSISVDDLVITDIKKRKLKIRDQIQMLNKYLVCFSLCFVILFLILLWNKALVQRDFVL